MKLPELQQGDLITVHWIDAVRYNSTYPLSDTDFNEDRVYTTGFYLFHTNDKLVITQERFSDGRCRGVNVFPTCMLLEVTRHA